ncbi:MAG: PKD domain-containing protein [Chitinophagales bacterium]
MKNLLLLTISLFFCTTLWSKCSIRIQDYYPDYKDDTGLTYIFKVRDYANSSHSTWAFGDGVVRTFDYSGVGKDRMEIHRYQFPGIYHVVVTTCEGAKDDVTIVAEGNYYIPSCEERFEYNIEVLPKHNELNLNLKYQLYNHTAWLLDGEKLFLGDSLNETIYYPSKRDLIVSSWDKSGYFMCKDKLLLDFEVDFHSDFTYRLNSYNHPLMHFYNKSWGEEYLSTWSFGDGIVSNYLNPSHSFTDVGTYEVCLYVEDTTLVQTANLCQKVTINCIGDFTFELDTAYANVVHFNFENTGLGVLPVFTFSNGDVVQPTKTSFTHIFPDTYKDISVCAKSPLEGCPEYYCHAIQFSTRTRCEAKFKVRPLREGFYYFFENTSEYEGENPSFNWNPAPYGYYSDKDSTEHIIHGNYHNFNSTNPVLKLTMEDGCYSEYTGDKVYYAKDIDRIFRPAPCFIVTETTPNAYQFENLTPFAHSYLWDFGDGLTDTSKNVTHHYESEGFYQVCLTAYKGGGFTEVVSQSFCEWLNIGNIDTCAARFLPLRYYQFDYGHVQFYNLSYDKENTANTYHWDFGDGNISTEITPIHQYEHHDTYEVCLTLKNENGCESQFCDDISAGCTSDISVSVYSSRIYITDNSLHHGDIYSRNWRVNGDYFNENDEDKKYIEIDNYSGKYNINDLEICLSLDGRVDCSDYCVQMKSYTSIESRQNTSLFYSTFPNPFNQTLHLEFPQNTNLLQITILDASGKMIYFHDNPNKKITLQTESWQTGLYFLQVVTPTEVSSQRILKIE